jgi:hypothetical protein
MKKTPKGEKQIAPFTKRKGKGKQIGYKSNKGNTI